MGNLLPPRYDLVTLRPVDADEIRVPWCAPLPLGMECSTILLPRMPATFEERAWMWTGLTELLATGASIRLVGPGLHA